MADLTLSTGWTIVDCEQKLFDKYGPSSFATVAYDHYATHVASQPPQASVITPLDAMMTNAMNSRMEAYDLCSLFAPPRGTNGILERVNAELHAIPWLATLTDHFNDSKEALAKIINDLCEIPYVKLAKTMKILALKRPGLVPMLDSLVVDFYCGESVPSERRHEPPEDAETFGGGAVALIERAVIVDVREHHQELVELATATESFVAKKWDMSVSVSPIRVLESLIWFDWGGWRSFAGWRQTAGQIQRVAP